MRIADRTENRVIANVHPLIASAAQALSAGNKHRIEFVSPFAVIIHNDSDFFTWRVPAIGTTRACPDCQRPQHYTGHENGWAHDALIDMWECALTHATLALADQLERIDDALRNTVGGRP